MDHANTQHDVTVINPLELFQAFAVRSTKRNDAILKERVATGADASLVNILIGDEKTHGIVRGISYPDDVTATCSLQAKGYEDITLVLTTHGWKGVAKSLN